LSAGMSDTASVANDRPWQVLEGLHPETSRFPARARVDGEGILIFKTAAGFRGVQRACPHLQASFLEAQVVSNGTMLRCMQHNYTFRFADGKGINCPGVRIRVFEVKQDGDVLSARALA
jgi:nitrite reductase/ring-hydroxylating ferredoxin subunit